MSPHRKLRLGYLVSHPIQYQAPLLRRIAAEPDIDLRVFFGSDLSVRSYKDEGFGATVEWDVPLLDGYQSEFLPILRDKRNISVASPISRGIYDRLRGANGTPPIDVLWVHGYATINALHGMIAARALGIPVLLRAESWLRDRDRSSIKLAAKHAFFRGLRQMVDAVLPIGTLNSDYWTHYLGEDMPQFLMPYAVDNDFFRARAIAATAGRAALIRELELEPGRSVILFASKLQNRKQCIDLVEATLRLATHLPPDRQPYLLIVGDGEERANLERRVALAGATNIRFCGFRNQSELPRFFDLANVFVLPSRHEPWGLIVNEVMNAGRAIIVSDDVGSQPDLITDGVDGCVYPVNDIDALTAALVRVLTTPGLAASMGERARERILSWSFDQDLLGLRAALEHVGRRLRA